MSFWIGNIVLLFLNVPLIGLWIKVLAIPYRILFPAIIVFVCIGTYSVNANAFDILILAAFTAIGYTFRLLGYSPAPLILGFVLGPMLEENLRRSLLVSRGDPSVFIDRPIALTILILTLAIITIPLVASAWRSRKGEVSSPVDD
jgi:TctA family transporter